MKRQAIQLLLIVAFLGSLIPSASAQTSGSSKTARCAQECFLRGRDAAVEYMGTRVSESSKPPFKMMLIVEDIDGSDSYRLAAAETVRLYFPTFFAIDPTGALILHVSGTKGTRVQSFEVSIVVHAYQSLIVGDQARRVFGEFVIAHEATTLTGYADPEKTQVVRELLYKVMSEYQSAWANAAPK